MHITEYIEIYIIYIHYILQRNICFLTHYVHTSCYIWNNRSIFRIIYTEIYYILQRNICFLTHDAHTSYYISHPHVVSHIACAFYITYYVNIVYDILPVQHILHITYTFYITHEISYRKSISKQNFSACVCSIMMLYEKDTRALRIILFSLFFPGNFFFFLWEIVVSYTDGVFQTRIWSRVYAQ